jgi:hypothetical protein
MSLVDLHYGLKFGQPNYSLKQINFFACHKKIMFCLVIRVLKHFARILLISLLNKVFIARLIILQQREGKEGIMKIALYNAANTESSRTKHF